MERDLSNCFDKVLHSVGLRALELATRLARPIMPPRSPRKEGAVGADKMIADRPLHQVAFITTPDGFNTPALMQDVIDLAERKLWVRRAMADPESTLAQELLHGTST